MNLPVNLVSIAQPESDSSAGQRPTAGWSGMDAGELLVYLAGELSDLVQPVMSFSQLGLAQIRDGAVQPLRLEQYLIRIDASGRRVLAMSNKLLDLSALQIEEMAYQMNIDDVRAIATEAAAEYSQMAKDKDVSVVIEQPRAAPLAWCDSARIAQLLRNLIGSAIDFSPAGKCVYIAFDEADLPCGPRHAGRPCVPALHVTVSDEGESVPDHQLTTLFDSPLRALATKRGAGVAALGMLICRSIVRRHGGSIWAQNQPDGGLAVNILLPRTDPSRTCVAARGGAGHK